jgi:integrase
MASITKIGDSWRALIRRKGHKTLCKTFKVKAKAEAWALQREAEIGRGEIVAEPGVLRLGEVIQAYRELRDQSRPISDTANEHYMLKRLVEGLGDKRAGALTPQDLVDYSQMRKEEGAGPYTINMEISKLGTVMRYAGAVMKIALPDVVGQARPLLNHLGMIGGGGKRERRPTEDEVTRLVKQLREGRGAIYADAVCFAIATAARRGEIVKLLWIDLDEAKKLIQIRDRKDPRQKIGNDQWIPLLGDAWDIVQRQDREKDRIFPVHEQTLSKYFKEACDALGIPDLHFHDLRHEGTSRLFEEGYEIQQVALVTGHKDWRHLRRYTNLKPEDLHRPAEVKGGGLEPAEK